LPSHISANSDNRRFCMAIQRPKFCYETLEKAQKACDYSPNPQRAYYCDFCQAYHTTHCMNISKQGEYHYAQKLKTINRRNNKNKKILYIRHIDNINRTIGRALEKDYRQVVKKYLIEYLDDTRNEIALSEEELKNKLTDILVNVDETALEETTKWPFCDLKSAMIFYALYWLQINGSFVGETASDLVDKLFTKNVFSDELKEYFERIFKWEWIVLVGGEEYEGIYALGSFNDEDLDKQKLLYEKMIAEAKNSNYHPAVKDLLCDILSKDANAEKIIQKEDLERFLNSDIIINPTDEKVQEAINETLKWTFASERHACQFLMLYYFGISDPIFVSRLDDIVYNLFAQGNRSNRFFKRIANVLYDYYSQGKIIVTEMRLGSIKYQLA